MKVESPYRKTFNIVLAVLIFLFAFGLSYSAGRRGFFAFDQSIVFDGGYRVASKQIPYRDFVIPAGPLVIWVQGLVFDLLGVTYVAYLATAAVVNGMASICVLVLLKRFYPESLGWPLLGAALTAIWFYPLFGTPWFEHSASMFGLLALVAVVPRKLGYGTDCRWWPPFAAGILIALAFLCKQNAGLFLVPLLAAAILAARIGSCRAVLTGLGSFTAGLAATGVSFLIWVAAYADFSLFKKHFWVIPSELASERVSGSMLYRVRDAILGTARDEVRLILLAAIAITALVLVVSLYNLTLPHWRQRLVASVVAVGAFAYQNLLTLTTLNDKLSTAHYLGLIVAVAGASLVTLTSELTLKPRAVETPVTLPARTVAARFLMGLYVSAIVVVAGIGLDDSFDRHVHDIFVESRFEGHCEVPLLNHVVWAHPTQYGGREIRCDDLTELVRLVQSEAGNILVIGDWTILYAMTGRPSTSPLLWYHRGLTYPKQYDPALDRWMLRKLRTDDVRIVIVQQSPFMGELSDFLSRSPRLQRYLNENFERRYLVGEFEVYRKSVLSQPKRGT